MDWKNLYCVVTYAKRLAARSAYIMYVVKYPDRDNYNITMAPKVNARIIEVIQGKA